MYCKLLDYTIIYKYEGNNGDNESLFSELSTTRTYY